jgi:hypothetical protein
MPKVIPTLDELHTSLDYFIEEAEMRNSLWSGRQELSKEESLNVPLRGWLNLLYQYHIETKISVQPGDIILYDDGTIEEPVELATAIYQTYSFWRGLLDHDFFELQIPEEHYLRFSNFIVSCLTRFTSDFPNFAVSSYIIRNQDDRKRRPKRFPLILLKDVELSILTGNSVPTISKKALNQRNGSTDPQIKRITFKQLQHKYKSSNFSSHGNYFSSEKTQGTRFFFSFDSATNILLRTPSYKPCTFQGEVEYIKDGEISGLIKLPDYSNPKLSKLLISAAVKNGLDLERLSKHCHLSPIAINRILRGTTRISLDMSYRVDLFLHQELCPEEEYIPFETSVRLSHSI